MAEKLTYEQAVARLDEIVHSMEKGDAPLEESLKMFEEGAALIAACGKMLLTSQSTFISSPFRCCPPASAP